MTRWFAILSCALALVVAAPLSFEAEAGRKVCKAKSLEGKSTKWVCKSGQKCCYSWLLNKGTCGADICL